MRVSGNFTERAEFEEILAQSPVATNEVDAYNTNLDSIYQFSDDTLLGFEATRSRSRTNQVPGPLLINHNILETSSLKGTVSVDSDTLGLFKATLYSNWLDNSIPSASFGSTGQLSVLRIEDIKRLSPKHVVQILTELRQAKNTVSSAADGSRDADAVFDIYSLGTMWDWSINKSMSLTTSLRYDSVSISKEGFNPVELFPTFPFTNELQSRDIADFSYNVGWVYKATNGGTLKVMAARGIGLPSMIDVNLTSVFAIPQPGGGVANIIIGGSHELDATVVQNYEISWDQHFKERGIDLHAGMFFQTQDDMKAATSRPEFDPVSGLVFGRIDNIGSSQMQGLETSLQGHFNENAYWRVNYTYTRIEDDFPLNTGVPYFFPAQFERAVPDHRLSINTGYESDNWLFDVQAHYTNDMEHLFGNFPIYTDGDVPGHLRVDAHYAYTFVDALTVSLRLQNLAGPGKESPWAEVPRLFSISLRSRF